MASVSSRNCFSLAGISGDRLPIASKKSEEMLDRLDGLAASRSTVPVSMTSVEPPSVRIVNLGTVSVFCESARRDDELVERVRSRVHRRARNHRSG